VTPSRIFSKTPLKNIMANAPPRNSDPLRGGAVRFHLP
jgi:hypothetical protein